MLPGNKVKSDQILVKKMVGAAKSQFQQTSMPAFLFQDKTFGLKNKKGGKAQKFIAQVEKQVKQGGDPKSRKLEEERLAEKKRKEEEKRLEDEKNALIRPVQKVEAGNDLHAPKINLSCLNRLKETC